MTLHMSKHLTPTGKNQLSIFACNECPRKFVSNGALLAHQRLHSNRTILKCRFCTLEFSNSDDLAQHQSEHKASDKIEEDDSKPKDYKCALCPAEFRLKSHLNVHRATQHSDRSKKYCCKKCPKSYSIE